MSRDNQNKLLLLCVSLVILTAGLITWLVVQKETETKVDPFDNTDISIYGLVSDSLQQEFDELNNLCENEKAYNCPGVKFNETTRENCKETILKGRSKVNSYLCKSNQTIIIAKAQIDKLRPGGFRLGEIDIPSFRITRQSTTAYQAGKSACGVFVYDVGTCPKNLTSCANITNGLTIIFEDYKYNNAIGSTAHAQAVYQYFNDTPTSLQSKYGMRFAGFSVKNTTVDGNPNGFPVVGFTSTTLNDARVQANGHLKDNNRAMNAYEASMVHMLVDHWINGDYQEIFWNDAAEYMREHHEDIIKAFGRYEVDMIENWKEDFEIEDYDPYSGFGSDLDFRF